MKVSKDCWQVEFFDTNGQWQDNEGGAQKSVFQAYGLVGVGYSGVPVEMNSNMCYYLRKFIAGKVGSFEVSTFTKKNADRKKQLEKQGWSWRRVESDVGYDLRLVAFAIVASLILIAAGVSVWRHKGVQHEESATPLVTV